MKFDENEIVDYFGEPHILVSTLNFHIDEMGAMHISSKKQWFYMFRRKSRYLDSYTERPTL